MPSHFFLLRRKKREEKKKRKEDIQIAPTLTLLVRTGKVFRIGCMHIIDVLSIIVDGSSESIVSCLGVIGPGKTGDRRERRKSGIGHRAVLNSDITAVE